MQYQPMRHLFFALFSILLLVNCGGNSGSGSSSGIVKTSSHDTESVPLSGDNNIQPMLIIKPTEATLSVGESIRLEAFQQTGSNPASLITQPIKWTAQNPDKLIVDEQGKITAKTETTEPTVVIAEYNGLKQSSLINITPAKLISIRLSFEDLETTLLYKGQSARLNATGEYSDGSVADITQQLSWSIDNTSAATLTGNAIVTATGVGDTRITAEDSGTGIKGEAIISIKDAREEKLIITPATLKLYEKQTKPFQANAIYTDKTSRNVNQLAQWQSNSDHIASSKGNGLFEGKAPGKSNIKASIKRHDGTVINAEASVEVSPAVLSALRLSPQITQLHLGESQHYQVIGIYNTGAESAINTDLLWSSSNPEVLHADPHTGTITPIKVDTGSITVTHAPSGLQQSIQITVQPAYLTELYFEPSSMTLPLGQRKHIKVMGSYNDGSKANLTRAATLKSDNKASASIRPNGKIKAKQIGMSQLTASFNGLNATAHVQVIEKQLKKISLEPSEVSLAKGKKQQLNVYAHWSDQSKTLLTDNVTYLSDNPSSLLIEPSGKMTAVSKGKAKVFASYQSVSANTEVRVTDAELTRLSIVPAANDVSWVAGNTHPLQAVGVFSDSSTQDLTQSVLWKSSADYILSVIATGDHAGFATAFMQGTANIEARDLSTNIAATQTYVVSEAQLTTLDITPKDSQLPTGNSLQLIAIGKFTDGKNRDITNQVKWTASPAGVVEISSEGVVSTQGVGSVTISGQLNGKSYNTSLTVVPAKAIKTLTITPAQATTSPLKAFWFKATVEFMDGTTLDVTKQGWWSSDNWDIASIIGFGISSGRAWTTGAKGSCTIKFKYKDNTAEAKIAVQ